MFAICFHGQRSVLEPGVFRCLNNSGEVLHGNTQLANLEPPRMLYFQVGCLTEFRRIQNIFQSSRHNRVLTRQEEAQVNLLSSRQVFSYLATALTKACLECRKYRDRSKHRKEAGGNYCWWFFPIHPSCSARSHHAPPRARCWWKHLQVRTCSRVSCRLFGHYVPVFRASKPSGPALHAVYDQRQLRGSNRLLGKRPGISRHLNHVKLVKSLGSISSLKNQTQ